MHYWLKNYAWFTLTVCLAGPLDGECSEPGLIGHWKLQGDCLDHSGHENHGVNHGVDLESGTFDGANAYIGVPASESLKLGTKDFTFSAHIFTDEQLDDIAGDVMEIYDPDSRRGITLTINTSAGGYQSQGTDRQIHFGIDNGKLGEWEDCGRPSPTSNYVSNSLTVYDGDLYAATSDAADEDGWCHVWRYEGGDKWADCGRVGDKRTTGVGPMIVHDGHLYVATCTYDWTRVTTGGYDAGRVYRYAGGTKWEDCGQPSENRTLNTMASYKGKLYAAGGPNEMGVFVQDGGTRWKASHIFPSEGRFRLFPHTMCRHNGLLYVAWPIAYAFNGEEWKYVGDPIPWEVDDFLQTHSMTIYQGKLHAGTWPRAKVSEYEGGEKWKDIGRVGVDGTEVNALVVYNGKLYGGSIPRAEVCRYDGVPQWTSLQRFYSPEGWEPAPPGQASRDQYNRWSRVTSLTVHDGRLFASTGSCTSSVLDAPADVRGKVFSMEAGKVASYGKDLGPGWKHIAAIRKNETLQLYIDGELVATSTAFDPAEYDVSVDQPMRIGFGQTEYFDGKMSDVRLYDRPLGTEEISRLSSLKP